jgi:IS5 family transposase
VHGYKAHVATDQEAGLIRGMEITTANIHDAAELEAVLPPEPGAVYGDSAFAGARPEGVIRVRGGTPRIVHTSTWGGPEALARLEAHNAEVRRVRARIEKVFGTVKRCYGLGLSEISCGSGMNGTKEPNHAQTQTASYS